MSVRVPFPVVITKENKWFVASCPILDIATQGRSEDEVRENISDLIVQYLKDPDTPKPRLDQMPSVSLSSVTVLVPEGVLHRKTSTVAPAQSH
ncbi:MAG: type II toxin-antitoxin system HicB family antitoxin [Nitrososphaerota archaeon]|nr:type II toxin-antitoxin system HicB family antitoxin [Nitrososphaerota archaeon]